MTAFIQILTDFESLQQHKYAINNYGCFSKFESLKNHMHNLYFYTKDIFKSHLNYHL